MDPRLRLFQSHYLLVTMGYLFYRDFLSVGRSIPEEVKKDLTVAYPGIRGEEIHRKT